MITITEQLSERLNTALAKLGKENLPSNFKGTVSAAADTKFGDYQTNAAMILAKKFGISPRDLALEIIKEIDVSDISSDPEIAGPGFINFKIHESTILSRVREILSSDRVGVEKTLHPEKILIDFSSPNIAKPMHIGHIRSTIIGDCLQRVANFLGHDVISDNHIGDWGTPIGQVIYGWKHELNETAFNEDPIKELLRLYPVSYTHLTLPTKRIV